MRTGGLDLPRRRYSMPETVMRKYRLRQRAESLTSESSSGGGGAEPERGGRGRRQAAADKCLQTSPRTSFTGSHPSLATPSPRAWSSDCQTVTDKSTSTQDSTLSVPSTEISYRANHIVEDIETQVSLPECRDRNTSITSLKKEYRDALVDIAINIETELSDGSVVDKLIKKDECIQVNRDSLRSIACQAGNQVLNKTPKPQIIKKEESSQVRQKDIIQEIDPLGFHLQRIRAEVACAGGNYDAYPIDKPVIPRYSAVPRTNSMLVNASSVEYSSDSELSLTDSLEDPEEFRIRPERRQQVRHDERPVRGEVAMEQERLRLPKARDAYAYFLSLTGEEDTIREYSIPDWLRERLRRREEEIKKVYEDKLSRHQQYSFIRRRKKAVKRIKAKTPYSSSERLKKNELMSPDIPAKNEKTVSFDNYGSKHIKNNVNINNETPGTTDKCAVTLLNGNNMGLEPKIDNIKRSNHNNGFHNTGNNGNNNNNNNNNNTGASTSHVLIQAENENRNLVDSHRLQISEIIKIEMSDDLRTVITKEKQIHLPAETKLSHTGTDSLKGEVTNTTKLISTKGNVSKITAELTDTNLLNSISNINTTPQKNENKLLQFTQKERVESHNDKYVETQSPNKNEKHNRETISEHRTSKFQEVSKGIIQNDDTKSQISLDRKIADILINALEENTKAHQLCGISAPEKQNIEDKTETTFESYSKVYVNQESRSTEKEEDIEVNKTSSISTQTDKLPEPKSDSSNENKLIDKTSNTEPYLVSIRIQTSDPNEPCEEQNDLNFTLESEQNGDESGQMNDLAVTLEPKTYGDLRMVDKACNTVESASISTQTNESILQSGDILNGFRKSKTPKKKEVQFPSQVIKQIITGTGEYKTIEDNITKSREKDKSRSSSGRKTKVNKGTNTEEESVVENNKNIINNNIEIMSNRGHPTPFCKNIFPDKAQNKRTQVLELNVPTCSCHMCTLQKISPRADPTTKSRIPQTKKPPDSMKDEKRTLKVSGRRGNAIGTKFQMFEVIPEEKNSSNESMPEDTRQETRQEGVIREEKGVLTDPHLVDRLVQVGAHIVTVATNTEPPENSESEQDRLRESETDDKRSELTQTEERSEETQTGSKQTGSTQTVSLTQKRSNLLIGRFRSESSRESPLRVRQYKGRASLSAGQVEGQEELLTLSKGWINFYLLKDNFDLSDSNNDEPPSVSGRRRVRTVERRKEEMDQIEEYTLEIHAAPESSCPRGGLLPNLKHSGQQTGNGLPDIGHTSSSSSTPENVQQNGGSGGRFRRGGTTKAVVESLPGVRKSKRTQRLDVKREAVLTERREGSDSAQPQATRSVEVARSEQSISSITSSTVILSESPPPQQLKLPERKSSQRRVSRSLQLHNGSSWTVTVAGSSGSGNDPPPDVEMKLSFAKHAKRQEDNMLQYQVARPKRQGRMIEDFSQAMRNEKQGMQCVQDLSLHTHQTKSCIERARGGVARDNFSYEEEYINRLSSRSRYSTEDGNETATDLHITGLAITPEKKPRVPTQSERDILRPQRYKFTR